MMRGRLRWIEKCICVFFFGSGGYGVKGGMGCFGGEGFSFFLLGFGSGFK